MVRQRHNCASWPLGCVRRIAQNILKPHPTLWRLGVQETDPQLGSRMDQDSVQEGDPCVRVCGWVGTMEEGC